MTQKLLLRYTTLIPTQLLAVILANVNNQQRLSSGPRVSVPKDQWDQLDNATKDLWKQIPIADRAHILGVQPQKDGNRPSRSAYLADTSTGGTTPALTGPAPMGLDLDSMTVSQYLSYAYHFGAMLHDTKTGTQPPKTPKSTPAQVQQLPVGDPHRLMLETAPTAPSKVNRSRCLWAPSSSEANFTAPYLMLIETMLVHFDTVDFLDPSAPKMARVNHLNALRPAVQRVS